MLELTDVLTFGQYKGKTILEIIVKNRGYIIWLRGERQKKNRENLLTPAADAHLINQAGKDYKVSPRLAETEVSGAKSVSKLEKAFKEKAEIETREIEANRSREEVYGQEWGGW
jgi:hypothetical protein